MITDVPAISDLETIFGNIIKSAIGFAAIVLFVYLLIGGGKYLLSGGDPKAVDSAQKTITYAIIGLLVVLGAYLILLFIQTLTGVNLNTFSITH